MREAHYLGDPAQVKLLPGVARALERLQRAGYKAIVVTNQSGLGRGLLTRAQVDAVRARFVSLLKGQGVTLDGYFECSHKPSDRCPCRKPKLASVKKAAKRFRRSWRGSIGVGDRPTDVALGQKTKGEGLLVLTGYGREWSKRRNEFKPNAIVENFPAAVRWILKTERKHLL